MPSLAQLDAFMVGGLGWDPPGLAELAELAPRDLLPCRCDFCGYLTSAIGHQVECAPFSRGESK